MNTAVGWRQLKNYPDFEIHIDSTVRIRESGDVMYQFDEYNMPYVLLPRAEGAVVSVLVEGLLIEAFPEMQEDAEKAADRVIAEAAESVIVKDTKQYFWIVTEHGFPHGLACLDCQRTIEVGQPYRERLSGMFDTGIPVSELVCVYC